MRLIGLGLLAGVALTSLSARADVTDDKGIDDHVDAVLARAGPRGLGGGPKQALQVDRLELSLGLLIPIFGSYALDKRVYGGLRPSAVYVDWILGGLIPADLALTALASGRVLRTNARAALAWTALGLYGATRAGVLIVGNLHISEYNRHLALKLGASAHGRGVGPALSLVADW